jgi:hypothetical protein
LLKTNRKYLNEKLTSTRYPNFETPFLLYTDAFDTSLGTVLSQKNNEEKEYTVIAYASRSLNKHEQNYAVIYLKCLYSSMGK